MSDVLSILPLNEYLKSRNWKEYQVDEKTVYAKNEGGLRKILRKTFKELDRLESLPEIKDLRLTLAWLGENSVLNLAYEANTTSRNFENIGRVLKKRRVIPPHYNLRDDKPQDLDDNSQLAYYRFRLKKDKDYNVELLVNCVSS